MIGVDTNVLVRLVTDDDAHQTTVALELLDKQALQVSLLALLETEWVLRSAHGFSRSQTACALRELLALDGIEIEDGALVDWAIDRHEQGADFGDMLLLIATRPVDRFATFDRRLRRHAGTTPPVEIVTLT